MKDKTEETEIIETSEPQSETSKKRSWLWRTPILVLAIAVCAGLTALYYQPSGGPLKNSVFHFLQLDKATAANAATVPSQVQTGPSSSPNGTSSIAPTSSAPASSKPAGSALASSSSASSAPASSAVSSQPDPDAVTVSLAAASKPLSIHVSIAEQKVLVLDAKGRVVENFECSTGKPGDDTPTGTFTISDRGKSFYNPAIEEGAYYWTRFQGSYLFHSLPFGPNQTPEPEEAAKLGTPASHGCIRLEDANAKWIYDHIPKGTKVTIE